MGCNPTCYPCKTADQAFISRHKKALSPTISGGATAPHSVIWGERSVGYAFDVIADMPDIPADASEGIAAGADECSQGAGQDDERETCVCGFHVLVYLSLFREQG